MQFEQIYPIFEQALYKVFGFLVILYLSNKNENEGRTHDEFKEESFYT